MLSVCCVPRYYWWRAQAAAYFVRFPNHVQAALHRHALKIYPSLNLPSGVIAVHVRRGDKIKEARICSDNEFLAAAEALEKRMSIASSHMIYLSTEDSDTVDFFRNTTFSVTQTDVERFHRSNVKVVDAALAHGIDVEMADSMVSLKFALQADGFVGDLSSNWVRLIDELRSTVMCKAHLPFVDPSQKDIRDLQW